MHDVKSPVFRTAVGGFNKKDVNEYIARLCLDCDTTVAELEKSLEDAKTRYDELVEANEKEAIRKESKELTKANNVISAQNEQLESLKAENTALRDELDALKARLTDLGEIEAKLAQYESMTNRMGEIFMEATADAERIKNEAKFASDAMLAKAEMECRSRRAAADTQLKKLAESRKTELTRLFDETKTGIGRILTAFSERSQSIVSDSLAEKLDSFETVSTESDKK